MSVPIERLALILVLAACTPSADHREATGVGQRLLVWTTDSDSLDLNFLAVLDADPRSPWYRDWPAS